MKKTVCRGRTAGTLTAPSSKSYAQRAVAAALLSQGVTTLTHMELCRDTEAALQVAQDLGATLLTVDGNRYTIGGGLAPRGHKLNIGESGLSTRLFTPIASLCSDPITLTGTGSILKRPIDTMFGPLRTLGVAVESSDVFLPITVHGPLQGGAVEVDGSLSSQFITGLLMALPLAAHDTCLRVEKLNSRPYIDMTLEVMQAFGVEVRHDNYQQFLIPANQRYTPTTYNIEGDWSGASCLLVAGATSGEITLENLNRLSLQADAAIVDALTQVGAEVISTPNSITVRRRELRPFTFDATDCPDLFPALVALAAACDGVSTIRGTRRLTHKESDRATTLAHTFAALGIEIDINTPDTMLVRGGTPHGATVSSHNDHRIAMAAAVAALRATAPVTISEAEAVEKSYPTFWSELESIRLDKI